MMLRTVILCGLLSVSYAFVFTELRCCPCGGLMIYTNGSISCIKALLPQIDMNNIDTVKINKTTADETEDFFLSQKFNNSVEAKPCREPINATPEPDTSTSPIPNTTDAAPVSDTISTSSNSSTTANESNPDTPAAAPNPEAKTTSSNSRTTADELNLVEPKLKKTVKDKEKPKKPDNCLEIIFDEESKSVSLANVTLINETYTEIVRSDKNSEKIEIKKCCEYKSYIDIQNIECKTMDNSDNDFDAPTGFSDYYKDSPVEWPDKNVIFTRPDSIMVTIDLLMKFRNVLTES